MGATSIRLSQFSELPEGRRTLAPGKGGGRRCPRRWRYCPRGLEGRMESLYLETGGPGPAALPVQGSPARSGKQRRIREGLGEDAQQAPQLPPSPGFAIHEFLLPLRRPKVCQRWKGTFPPCNAELLPSNLEQAPWAPGRAGSPSPGPQAPHSPTPGPHSRCARCQGGGATLVGA